MRQATIAGEFYRCGHRSSGVGSTNDQIPMTNENQDLPSALVIGAWSLVILLSVTSVANLPALVNQNKLVAVEQSPPDVLQRRADIAAAGREQLVAGGQLRPRGPASQGGQVQIIDLVRVTHFIIQGDPG